MIPRCSYLSDELGILSDVQDSLRSSPTVSTGVTESTACSCSSGLISVSAFLPA